MMEIQVNKNDLLTILNENKAKHQTVFAAAVDGWREHALSCIAETEATIRAGRLPKKISIVLPAPENHARDYDRVIGMLTMHQGDTFILPEQEYSWYVDDNWDWKRRWTVSNSGYAAAAMSEVYGVDYLETQE